MSLLHQDSPEEIDDAALGEELTKGTSHVVWATIAAAVLVTIMIAAYVIAGRKPPMATGEIVAVWAHPQHTVTRGFDAAGAPMPQESYDRVLVFAQVKLHNQGDKPLFLYEIVSSATLEDGVHASTAVPKSEFEHVFVAYPELAALHGKALSLDATIDPGQTQEGMVVFHPFRVTKPQWAARKDLNFTFKFQYQPSLSLAPHTAVIEQ
jgi:hypothetical protein